MDLAPAKSRWLRAQVLLLCAEQMSRLSSLLRPAPFALPALSASPALPLMPRACAAVGRGQRGAASAGAPAKRRCENITWQEGAVSREAKERLLNQRGCVLWFTGLSGSGKSTVACTLEHALAARGILTTLLDGDNVRHGLNSNLGFSAEDREENVRRIGEVAKLMVEAGLVTLASFISPYRADRNRVRARQKPHDFIEIYMKARAGARASAALLSSTAAAFGSSFVSAQERLLGGVSASSSQHCATSAELRGGAQVPLEVCEERDCKGLYKLARAGKLKGFTGVDDPYEEPERAEIVLEARRADGSLRCPEEMAAQVMCYLEVGASPLAQRACAAEASLHTSVPVSLVVLRQQAACLCAARPRANTQDPRSAPDVTRRLAAAPACGPALHFP